MFLKKFVQETTRRAGLFSWSFPRALYSTGPNDELERTFVDPSVILDTLSEAGIDFYTGVPDSLLKDLCGYVSDRLPAEKHVIAANEGSAIALASGAYLATGKIPFVYMQNSGLGNAVNPLLSLADHRVYGIPMVLMIGWRGEPGKKDEPQHMVQGDVLQGMLAAMDIRFNILPDYNEGAIECIKGAVEYSRRKNTPSVILVRKRTFESYTYAAKTEFGNYSMSREDALEKILSSLQKHDMVVGTTGFASREIFEIRKKFDADHSRDFLTVGSMGHASAIAHGIALKKPSRSVYCIDGDGACLMHLGNMAVVGTSGLSNLKHILINNGVHDSVGAQKTSISGLDYSELAKTLGYKFSKRVDNLDELECSMQEFMDVDATSFLEVRVRPGARKDLGRPTTTTYENKKAFMTNLQG